MKRISFKERARRFFWGCLNMCWKCKTALKTEPPSGLCDTCWDKVVKRGGIKP